MFRWILLSLLVFFVGAMLLSAYIVQVFGWMGLLAVMAGAAVFAYVLARFLPRFLLASMTAPLKQLGKVLDGATVKVNSFAPTDPPADFDEHGYVDEDERPNVGGMSIPRMKPLEWFELDVTITPKSSREKEPETLTGKKWQPDALLVVQAGEDEAAPSFMGGFAHMAGGGMGVIVDKMIWDGLEFVPHDGDEVWGIQRLRLHIGLQEGVQRIAFIYQMFVRFGDIAVPGDRALPGR